MSMLINLVILLCMSESDEFLERLQSALEIDDDTASALRG
jgi:hypothetical protein